MDVLAPWVQLPIPATMFNDNLSAKGSHRLERRAVLVVRRPRRRRRRLRHRFLVLRSESGHGTGRAHRGILGGGGGTCARDLLPGTQFFTLPTLVDGNNFLSQFNSCEFHYPQPEPTLLDIADGDRGGVGDGGIAESVGQDAEFVIGTPPRWVPDEEAPACMGCQDLFTLFKRRHHCRWDGQLSLTPEL